MTSGNGTDAAMTSQTPHNSPFNAAIETDPEIASTVITLTHEDTHDPKRNITVCIAPDLGSNMFRFRIGEHDIIYCESDLLKRRAFTGNFVLWPLPGRIKDKKYTYRGQEYSLADVKVPHHDPNLVHGLVFNQQWQYEKPVIAQDSVSVRTYIDVTPHSPFYKSYPFESRFSLDYVLSNDGVSINYTVSNHGSKDMPFGFSLHPYFSTLSGKENTHVTLLADAVMETDNSLLPTGRVLSVDGIMYAMFDLRQPMPIAQLKLDHTYTGIHTHESAIIEYKEQGMALHIAASPDFTHAVIFTAPFEAGGPFFCLEHQTCSADAVNLHAQGHNDIAHLLEVHPGETSTGTIEYKITM